MAYTFNQQLERSVDDLQIRAQRIHKMCSPLHSVWEAQDLLNEALLRAVASYPPDPKDGQARVDEDLDAFRAWVYVILKNVALSEVRKVQLEQSSTLTGVEYDEVVPSTDLEEDHTLFFFQIAFRHDPSLVKRLERGERGFNLWQSTLEAFVKAVKAHCHVTSAEQRVLEVLGREIESPGQRSHERLYSLKDLYHHHCPDHPEGWGSFSTTRTNIVKKLKALDPGVFGLIHHHTPYAG